MEKNITVPLRTISPENNELNKLARKLVALAVRRHGTIDLRSLTKEDLDGTAK